MAMLDNYKQKLSILGAFEFISEVSIVSSTYSVFNKYFWKERMS